MLLGIIPGAGGTQRLPRLCGAKMALEMCTDGKPVAAPKALAAGIIDHIVEGDLLTGAIAFAQVEGDGAARSARSREIALSRRADQRGLEACAAMRAVARENREGPCRRRSPPSTPSKPA